MKFEKSIALRYFTANRQGVFSFITTAIAVAGVAVGVAALLTTVSVMNGFQDDIKKRIIGAQSHLLIYGEMPPADYADISAKLLKEKEITAVSPMIFGQAILSRKPNSTGVVVRGVDIEKEKKASELLTYIVKGSWTPPAIAGEARTPSPIVLGQELAYNMGLIIGDDVFLTSPSLISTGLGYMAPMKKFRISGLIKTGYYDFDNTMAYLTIDDAGKFFNLKGAVTGMEIRLTDVDLAERIKPRVSDIAGGFYSVRTFADMNRNLYSALKLEKLVMFLILALIILVAALNIASNLILLGAEKMKDIGIMRAMGAAPINILKIFWLEGLLIGTIGTALGIVLGLGLCWAISTYDILRLPSEIYYITRVPVSVHIFDVAVIVVSSYILCILAALYPAWRCSRVKPVDAIRYG